MSVTNNRSRRSVLKFGAGAAALSLANIAPLSGAGALNRSCVCLYLLGGCDSNNMIVPLDSPGYDLYARGRGALAIPRNSLLGVYSSKASAAFGFHPNLAGIQDLYNQGIAAVIANVGRSATPVNRSRIRSNHNELPADLFLHSGASQIRYLPSGYLTLSWAPGMDSNDATRSPVALLDSGVTVASSEALPARPAAPSKPLRTGFPQTAAGRMLESAAKFLGLGIGGQHLLVCPLSGFETRANQLALEAALFTEINDAVTAFYASVQEMGMADRVTLFTQTEFSRTLAPNRTGGTEPGWGGHQLVVGKPVLGGQVYGRFPSLALGGPDDAGATGVWIPSVSDVQYAATLASWLGRTDLANVRGFAGLSEFAETNLGFLAN